MIQALLKPLRWEVGVLVQEIHAGADVCFGDAAHVFIPLDGDRTLFTRFDLTFCDRVDRHRSRSAIEDDGQLDVPETEPARVFKHKRRLADGLRADRQVILIGDVRKGELHPFFAERRVITVDGGRIHAMPMEVFDAESRAPRASAVPTEFGQQAPVLWEDVALPWFSNRPAHLKPVRKVRPPERVWVCELDQDIAPVVRPREDKRGGCLDLLRCGGGQ